MANNRNAKEFIEDMTFITEESEERLRDGEPLTFRLTCTAKRPARNFLAFAGMLKSKIADLASIQEGDQIDLDALADSNIPSVLANNTLESDSPQLDEDIVNVPDEMHQKIQPGWDAEVVVRLNENDGTTYLNGTVIDVHTPDRGDTEQVSYEEEVQKAEAPSEA